MNVEIRDIGKIEYADIRLDGITVIAGENNTGKSTIGKTVFSVFNGLSSWQRSYSQICANKLRSAINKLSEKLEIFCMDHTNAVRRRTNRVNKLITDLCADENFIAYIEDYKYASIQDDRSNACCQIKKQLSEFCIDYVWIYQKNALELIQKNKVFFDEWVLNTTEYLKDNVELDERILQGEEIRKSFLDCFKNQYVREGTENGFVDIWDNDKKYEIKLTSIGINISAPIRFDRNVYFIESPKLFDEIGGLRSQYNAREELQNIMVPNFFLKLRKNSAQKTSFWIDSDDTIGSEPQELTEILKMLKVEMGGYAQYYAKEGIKFRDNSLKTPVYAQNVSTGLKAMAFLEYALRIGAIQKNDVLVLDEPEINLHPEWQVSYARALVLLHQKYNLTILITSHSPYFIRAIECLSDKYNVMDNLNVYLVDEDNNGRQQIDNVMESEYGMTELYDRLSSPLDNLQNEINEKYE